MIALGCDFSINKPAVTIYKKNTYEFLIFPFTLSDNLIKIYETYGVNIFPQPELIKHQKPSSSSEKVRKEILEARLLSEHIISSICRFIQLDELTFIGFEGSSFASKGNVAQQLATYRYKLIDSLSNLIPLENIFNYAPITLKKRAGCSEKGKGKSEMIEAFIKFGPNCKLKKGLIENRELFKKRGSNNWIEYLDDIIDSYWATQELMAQN